MQTDVAAAAVSKAHEVGGSVRLISKTVTVRDVNDETSKFSEEEIMKTLSGFVQVSF